MKKTVLLILISVLFFAGCAKNAESSPDEADSAVFRATEAATSDEITGAQTEPLTEAPTEGSTEAPTIHDLAKEKYNRILSGGIKGKSELNNVSALNQMDGMQAGCEALALTAAINHFGYDLGIDDIVDNYLEYDDSCITGFCGDPHYFYDGAGIYPPGIVTTAWNFINEKKAKFYPFDTTGLSMEELYKFIDNGCPVLIWTTYDRNSPYIEYSTEYNGIEYPWYDTEHCVCLFGYDKGEGLVKVADSWGGYEDWESAESFGSLYDEIGRFSVILMPDDDLM